MIAKLFSMTLAAIVFTTVALNETGFCFAKARWLSDQEIISIAVNHEISGSDRLNVYESAADFFAKNKNCCFVDRFSSDSMLPGTIAAAFGDRYALVELFYGQPVFPPHEDPFYDASMGISACGKVGEWRGIDAQAKERPRGAQSWGGHR